MKNTAWPIIIIALVVLSDQATKLWALSALTNQPPAEFFGNLLAFTLVFNQGGALGTSFGSSTYYLVSGLLILAFLLYYLYHHRQYPVYSWPLSFVAGGAIGNLIDRIRFGYVVDFIDVDIPDINLFGFHLERWWTFNIADAAISCSIVFLIIHLLFFHKRQPASNENTSDTSDSN